MIWVREDLFKQVIISIVYNIRKSRAQKPRRILRLMKAAKPKRCLSSAEVNPRAPGIGSEQQ